MVFDIKNFPGKYVMQCETEKEAEEFLSYLDGIGMTWKSGFRYTDTYWHHYKSRTCYDFNAGQCSPTEYYLRHGYKILKWSDFSLDDSLKVDPLKDCKSCLYICKCCENQSKCSTCRPFGSNFRIFNSLFCKLSDRENKKGLKKCVATVDEFDWLQTLE